MTFLESIWNEIEEDHTWRTDEIRFFQNQLVNVPTEPQKDQFRRAIVLLLYAHFEGFCKFAFTLYVNAVNRQSIKCKEANFSIAAASLADLFNALRNPDKKNQVFRNSLPNDEKLHRFARDKDFVEESDNFNERTVLIPDDVVDMESNLKPVVLRKNLFRLGFSHDSFESIEGEINKLLNYRNKIAHGAAREGLSRDELEGLTNAALRIMREVKQTVMDALTNRKYLKAS
ncbi:hypothetical protein WSM22_44930 [Cytophagales bacterium WSM2-2]|nr:hypothetical protein WSM22_44930 [Cytophagales bacterium WSM2-2]